MAALRQPREKDCVRCNLTSPLFIISGGPMQAPLYVIACLLLYPPYRTISPVVAIHNVNALGIGRCEATDFNGGPSRL